MIEIKHVTKIYGGTHKAVDDISLEYLLVKLLALLGQMVQVKQLL